MTQEEEISILMKALQDMQQEQKYLEELHESTYDALEEMTEEEELKLAEEEKDREEMESKELIEKIEESPEDAATYYARLT